MKDAALKESEKKQVIIGTYAMAAEGLDIKTLTTLIMATPKTDIEQSVGRILREKHGSPVVVDVIVVAVVVFEVAVNVGRGDLMPL